MRAIKFRAWCAWEREMVNFSDLYIELEDGCLSVFKLVPNAFGLSDRIEMDTTDGGVKLMQFTGLLDANSTEIYEGDIAEVEYMPCSPDTETLVAQAVYKDGGFVFVDGDEDHEIRLSNFTYEPYTNSYHPYRCFVIGNIYIKPELLKEVESE